MTKKAVARAGRIPWPAVLLIAVALGSLRPLSLAAQDSAPSGDDEEPPIFSEQIRVEIVELEVMVSARDGTPIRGLERDDFQVRVDGEPAEITNFYVVGAAKGRSGSTPEAAQDAIASFDQRLRLAILVDLPTLPFGRARQVLDDVAAATVEALREGDQVLVATLDRDLEVAQPFTDDHAAAAAALRAAGTGSGRIGEVDRELRRIVQDLLRVTPPPSGAAGGAGFADPSQNAILMVQTQAHELRVSIDHYAERRALEARQTVQFLAATVDRLSGLVGRKVVLYVGGGFEDRPGAALSQAWVDKFSHPAYQVEFGGSDELPASIHLSSVFARLGEHANARGVMFYALAPDTGIGSLGISAEIQGPDPATRANLAGAVGTMYDATRGAPLTALAGQTGGVARVGGGDVRRFVEEIRRDVGSYYSLGIRLDASDGADKRRRVKVRVDRPGARVRHQATVRPRTPIEKAEGATLAALVHGEGENGFDLSVDFGAAEPSEKGRFVLPMTVRFPLVRLAFVPQGAEHVGRATLLIATMDADQDLSSVQTVELPIRIPTTDLVNALQELGQYEAKLQIRPGRHRIAVGLHDEIGDGTSTVVTEHDVVPP